MGTAASPPGEIRPRRGRRWLVRGGLAALVVLAAAFLLRTHWLGPLAVRVLRQQAAERGAELTIERVSGGWLAGVALEGVTWKSTRGPLLRVDEARVEVGWSLRGLLRGTPELTLGVQARGIELGPGGADTGAGTGAGGALPELAFDLELSELRVRRPGHAPAPIDSLRARGALVAGRAQVEQLELAVGRNRVTLEDAQLDLARSGWLEIVRSARGQLALSLPEPQALAELLARPLPLTSAELVFSAESGCARVIGRAEVEGGQVVVESGLVTLPVDGDFLALDLDLDLQAEFSDLAPLGRLLGQPLAGRWQGAIDVQGPLRAPTGRIVGRGEALEIAGVVLDTIELDLQTDGDSARFERCEARGPDFEAVLRGEVRLEPLEFVDVALDLSARDSALRSLLALPVASAFVHARLSGPLTAPRGSFEASVTGVELGRFRIDDAQARGTLDGERLEVAELRLTSGESALEGAGSLRRTGAEFAAELERLSFAWRGAEVAVERGARFTFGSGRFALDGLELRSRSEAQADAGETESENAGDNAAEGRATLTLRHADGVTRGVLECRAYDAGPLLAPFLPAGVAAGRTSGRIEGSLGGAAPTLTFALALTNWSLHAAWPPLAGELRGELDDGALALDQLELGYTADEAARVTGTLRVPLDPERPLALLDGPVALRLALETGDVARTLRRAALPAPAASGPGRIEADLAGTWHALTGELTLAAEDVALGSEFGARTADLSAALELGDHVRVREAVLSAPSGTLRLAGTLGATPDVPAWLADRWLLLEAPLALELQLDLADVSWAAGLSRDVRRIAGQVAGRLTLTGNVLRPRLAGALELRAGELRLASLAFPLRALEADLRFEGETVQVERLVGEVGGAPLRAHGTLEPFGPHPRLDLVVQGERLLLARDANLLVRADADVVVKGTASLLSLRGELVLAEGRYRGEISPLEELLKVGKRPPAARPSRFTLWPEEPLASAELDLRIRAGEGEKRAFEYSTNLMSASLRPDVWLRGTGAYPVLEGQVYVDQASLILPSGVLELSSGLLTFRREAPLVPDLALTAQMRAQGHLVRLTATGTLQELEVSLSSSPPLASDDLWVLVVTGQMPVERWEDNSSQAMEELALFLARDTLVRWFEDEPSDTEGLLERFEIDVGTKTSQSGQPTGRVLFYLRPRDLRSGRATYLSAEMDEYDRVNYALGIVFRPR